MQKSISFILALSMALAVGASATSAQTEGSTGDTSSSATNNTAGTGGIKRPLPPRIDARQRILDQRGTTTTQKMGQERMMLGRGTTTGTSTMGERRAERMEKLSAQRKEIIKRQAAMMFKRIEAAIERLKKLGDRIGERIAKLKEKGVNTTKSEALLASARTEITNAETALAAAKTAAQGAIESGTPKEAFEAVRTNVVGAREAAKKAHKALVDSVIALKGKSGDKTATTTATTTAQ